MTRVARMELLSSLRRERDGILLDAAGLREPMRRRFRRRPMEPLAAQCLANEAERIAESRKMKGKLKKKGKSC